MLDLSTEQHFKVNELAKKWGVNYSTLLRRVQDREDVIRFGEEHPRGKRKHISIRIPESVAKKVYAELCGR